MGLARCLPLRGAGGEQVTFIPGLGPCAAKMMGLKAGSPRVVCDSCGVVRSAGSSGPLPMWVLHSKAPPGWEQFGKFHRCGKCKKEASK